MKPLLLIALFLPSCALAHPHLPPFEDRLASVQAAEDRGEVGRALDIAYRAFAERTGRGFTKKQLQDIADTVQIYWMPDPWDCKGKHVRRDGSEIKKCSGYTRQDPETGEWTMKIVARQCLTDTPIIHEFLHILRSETYLGLVGRGDKRHLDVRVFEHPDPKAAPRFSAEWVGEKAFVEVVGCIR